MTMSKSSDYLQKYDAAKDEVLEKANILNREAVWSAFNGILTELHNKGYTRGSPLVRSVEESFGKTLFSLFYQEEADKLKPAIQAMANEAALKYGLNEPLDIVGKGN